jgi:seryl-tRNA synthetase
MPELFRKQAVRLEELEKENKRLEKEVQDTEGRWKKSEEELDDLREANGEVVELKDRMERAEKKAAEVEKLVGYIFLGLFSSHEIALTAVTSNPESRNYFLTTAKLATPHQSSQRLK